MSNNYHIRFNQQPPSSEDIAKHKDFDALLTQFQAEKETAPQPVRRRPARIRQLYYVSGAVAAALIGALLIIGIPDFSGSALSEKEYFAQQDYVNPPLNHIKPTFASFKVDVNQGGVYEYESGSRIVVPAAAFMNDYGSLISGEVEIFYREMHDHVDFFMAGIPMTYDSAGVTYLMESAGMVEIYAEQNGVRVKMAPNKNIDVELVSTINVPNLNVPPGYNIYKLDTASRNWVYQNVDLIQILDEPLQQEEGPLKALKEQLLNDLAAIDNEALLALQEIENSVPKPVAPIEPRAMSDDGPTFEMNILDGILQEGQEELQVLQDQFGNVIWQVAADNPDYDERAFGVVWQNAKLIKKGEQDYQLTLIHEARQVNLNIIPVLTGDDYDTAMESYQSDLAAYQEVLKAWEAQVADQKAAIEAKAAEKREKAQNDYLAKLNELSAASTEISSDQKLLKRKVVNRFQANEFGIWNCDRLIAPSDYTLKASFQQADGEKIDQKVGYLVDKTKNTIYRFYINNKSDIQFNSDSKNLLWIVTSDDQIAICKPEDLKRINQKKGSHTFQVQPIEKEINSEADLRKYLEF